MASLTESLSAILAVLILLTLFGGVAGIVRALALPDAAVEGVAPRRPLIRGKGELVLIAWVVAKGGDVSSKRTSDRSLE